MTKKCCYIDKDCNKNCIAYMENGDCIRLYVEKENGLILHSIDQSLDVICEKINMFARINGY